MEHERGERGRGKTCRLNVKKKIALLKRQGVSLPLKSNNICKDARVQERKEEREGEKERDVEKKLRNTQISKPKQTKLNNITKKKKRKN